MRRSLSYADAVKVLGGADNKTVKALDVLTGGLLLAGTVGSGLALSLFDAKAELARLSRELVGGLTGRLSGLSRYGRAERLMAAHTVLVITGFLEAVEEIDLPIDLSALKLSRSESVAIVTGGVVGDSERLRDIVGDLLTLPIPLPSPHHSHRSNCVHVLVFYKNAAESWGRFMAGLAVAEGDETRLERAREMLREEVPDLALRRYEELVGRLADEFPEVAFWLNLAEHEATRRELRTSLRALEEALTALSSGRIPDDRRTALTRGYRAALDRGVVETADASEGLHIPSLGEAYIDHRFRAASLTPGHHAEQESTWEKEAIRNDLWGFFTGYLTSPAAAAIPLVVLGQPGSGKSVLTKVLAARLPPNDFLVVRVVLREAPADADLQTQIEHAVRATTGEALSWPDLVRTADGALPVVLLDGFDELLQATGVSQSDYLEQVVRFQEREADQGRPVAVVVTSRTAVADRARVPREGAMGLRLDPFGDDQVRDWMRVWNSANATYLATRGLGTLPHEAMLRYRHLAGQPLLLLMLALYDADANALQRDGGDLNQAELYERLLVLFAEREVAKTRAGLDEASIRLAVEEELRRLSIVAFAMFNRDHQWVTEDELNADLAALLGDQRRQEAGFRKPLTAAQTVIGRFFFTHQAQAQRDGEKITTCEFLHATFGEFLISRLVVHELTALAEEVEFNAARNRPATPDDALLYALLSFSPLAKRSTILRFIEQIAEGLPAPRRETIRDLILTWFRRALEPRSEHRYNTYEPVRLPVTARPAVYTANLLLLAGTTGGRPITGRELFPGPADIGQQWRAHALLWRSQLNSAGWFAMTSAINVDRTWDGDRREIQIGITDGILHDSRADLYWSEGIPPGSSRRGDSGWIRDDGRLIHRRHQMLATTDDLLIHALEPLIFAELDGVNYPLLTAVAGRWPDRCISAAHALVNLWVTSGLLTTQQELLAAYEDCLTVAESAFDPTNPTSAAFFLMFVIRHLMADAHRLPNDWLATTRNRAAHTIGRLVREDKKEDWVKQSYDLLQQLSTGQNAHPGLSRRRGS